MATDRDEELRDKAHAHGAEWGLRIIEEARREDVPISMAFALVEQESGFINQWGHDRDSDGDIIWPGRAGVNYVTEDEYREYKRRRGTPGRSGRMQGVGLTQLTWWEYQNMADSEGGCWNPRYQCRIGFRVLRGHYERYDSWRKALAVYNGGASNPNYEYADSVLRKRDRWHEILT
jgi:hypothetical protein